MEEGHTIALKISAQNAAVLITREKTLLMFETFELSAKNESVQSARGRLVRDFPASAIAVNSSLLLEAGFTSVLTKMLSTMSGQSVPEMQTCSKKISTTHEEDRDTPRPVIVSELFLGMLRGIGAPHYTTSVTKRTREEVLFNYARKPWRRSAMWLLVRVALQLTILRSPDGSLALYKNVILFIMCRLLSLSQQFQLHSELMHVMNAKIDRRSQKLLHIDTLLESVALQVESVLRKTYDIVSTRWTAIQLHWNRDPSMAALNSLPMASQTAIALSDLNKYIALMQSGPEYEEAIHYRPISGILKPQHGPSDPQPLPSSSDDYAIQNIQLFEQWVSQDIDIWKKTTQSDPISVCRDVCQLIKRYHTIACQVYANNPEGLSVMLVTIMKLWISCDRAAIGTFSLLRE